MARSCGICELSGGQMLPWHLAINKQSMPTKLSGESVTVLSRLAPTSTIVTGKSLSASPAPMSRESHTVRHQHDYHGKVTQYVTSTTITVKSQSASPAPLSSESHTVRHQHHYYGKVTHCVTSTTITVMSHSASPAALSRQSNTVRHQQHYHGKVTRFVTLSSLSSQARRS